MEQLCRFRHFRVLAHRTAFEELGQLVIILCARASGTSSQFLGPTNCVFEYTAEIGAFFIGGLQPARRFACVALWVRGGACHVGHYLAKPRAMARALGSAAWALEPLSARTPSQAAA